MGNESTSAKTPARKSSLPVFLAIIVAFLGFQLADAKFLTITNKSYSSIVLLFISLPIGFAFSVPKRFRWYSLVLIPFLGNFAIDFDQSAVTASGESCAVLEAYIPGRYHKGTISYSDPIAHLKCGENEFSAHVSEEAFFTAESNHVLSKYEGRLGFEYYR
jgi:hypothetical protein